MKVLVIGDSCTDKFVYGVCDRICPEAPVPVFNPTYQKANGGMAKNVFNNLVSLAKNWDIDLITNEDEITKTRLVDIKTNQMLLRVDEDDSCKRIKNDVITKLGDYDAIIISDYNKGFLTESTIKFLVDRYPLSFIDSKKLFNDWINDATFLKINEVEFNRNKKNLKKYKGNLIVTLGERGVKYKDTIIPPTRQAEVSDLSGAGDTFFAAFIFSYLTSKNIIESIAFAQKCALEVIEKKGVVVI
jgi:bifunctional ADP-heptose synthase (sugar kinase/adenylyltransferase)|tara:strand:- start:1389 stop:2120 length:732 start_codon:yes stop_codon:yes gene_type:complete